MLVDEQLPRAATPDAPKLRRLELEQLAEGVPVRAQTKRLALEGHRRPFLPGKLANDVLALLLGGCCARSFGRPVKLADCLLKGNSHRISRSSS